MHEEFTFAWSFDRILIGRLLRGTNQPTGTANCIHCALLQLNKPPDAGFVENWQQGAKTRNALASN